MLQPVIIMGKGTTGVVLRVYEDALDSPCKLLHQNFQSQKVVPEDQHIIGIPVAIGLVRVFYQNPRFQLWLNILTDPG